jgi:hypothetical protein
MLGKRRASVASASFLGFLLVLLSACGAEIPADSAEPADDQATYDAPVGEAAQASSVVCSSPNDCLDKCDAASKYCGAAFAYHPNKGAAGGTGNLTDCIDTFPSAAYGGSYFCKYEYPNGDACIFAHAAHFGPLHPPAPPPLCVYKST